MNILSWLKIGIIMFISLTVEEIELDNNSISAIVRVETLLTKEMTELINHGVTIEFELYNSLLLKSSDGNVLLRNRIIRSVSYDFYNEKYILKTRYNYRTSIEDEVLEVLNISEFSELNEVSAYFGRVRFDLPDTEYNEISWFSQISIIPNVMVEDELGQNTESLWDNHSPSVTRDFMR